MFTALDIIHVAIQIERNGEATYQAAAAGADDSEVAAVLRWMAGEEQRHASWFERLKLSQQVSTPEEKEMVEFGRRILQDMVKSQTFSLEQDQLQSSINLSELFASCRSFEEDTIKFYQFLAGMVSDPLASEQLEQIICEEGEHLRQLEELLARCA